MRDNHGRATFGATGLDDELEMIRDQFRRYADEHVIPFAHDWHLKDELIPMEVIGQLAEMGVFGLTIPEEYGGSGMGKIAMCVVSEELSRGYIGVGSLGTRSEIAGELIKIAAQRQVREAPRFETGRYSKYLPTRLAGRYEEARADPELLALRDDIALLDTRVAQTVAALDTGESADAVRIGAEAALGDHRVGRVVVDVQHRGEVPVDAEKAQAARHGGGDKVFATAIPLAEQAVARDRSAPDALALLAELHAEAGTEPAVQAALVAEEEAVRAHRALTVASHKLASTIAAAPTGTPQDFAALAALLDRRRRGARD